MKTESLAEKQNRLRSALFAAHQKTVDKYWDDDGRVIKGEKDDNPSYREVLGHCLSYLLGDAHCVQKANRMIVSHFTLAPCHFSPVAALTLLVSRRELLTPEATCCLEQLIDRNVPYMSTDDLRIHGFNDNHPLKAIYALVIGGELLGSPHYVELGLDKLREGLAFFERNGFPSEYNSPNYTVSSIGYLANLVDQSANEEARDIGLRLERYFWQDLALHFEPRSGLPAGPYSRAYVNDYSGLISGTLMLLTYLFPEHFAFNLIHEVYELQEKTQLVYIPKGESLRFYQYHPVWYAYPTYHWTKEIEEALFTKPAGTYVRGMIESGSFEIGWDKPENKPAGAPAIHHVGPRKSLVTTYFGKGFSLGTAQYAWLDNGQSHGFIATVPVGSQSRPQEAALYYPRMFFDEHSPYGEFPYSSHCFRDDGEIRTLQHRDTAIVFYNPIPYLGRFSRLHAGIFRPIMFNQPKEVYVGETPLIHLNGLFNTLQPIAIHDGEAYLGFIPLRLTNLGQKRGADLQIQTYGDHLAILFSALESWQPRDFSYDTIMGVCAGFICEARSADDFSSFADFRRWLAQGNVKDEYVVGQYANLRTTIYRRDGLELSASYSPFQSAFRHVAVNGKPLSHPRLEITGIKDPGYGLGD